jgi:hypothetical protein
LLFGRIANFDAACEAGFFGLAADVPTASFLPPDLLTVDLVRPVASDVVPDLLLGWTADPLLGTALRGGNFDVADLVFRAM